MEQKYFVFRAYRYRESGNWEYKVVGMYDSLSEAKQAFHSNMGAIIKQSNDLCMCIIFDSFGNPVESEFDSTYVEPEPPTPEPEEEIIEETIEEGEEEERLH